MSTKICRSWRMTPHAKASLGTHRRAWAARRISALFALITSALIGTAEAATFPLSVHSSGRYLVDATGAPFFMVGDAAQSAAGALTYEEWVSYVDARVSQGFNTLNVNFMEHKDAPAPPADRSGNTPFRLALGGHAYTSTAQVPDFTSPNDAYWAEVERKVAYAEARGVLVSLALYMWGDGGWYVEVQKNSLPASTSFGRYLADGNGGTFRGFGQHRNVMWVWGADHLFSSRGRDVDVLARLHAIAGSVRSAVPAQLMSGDWGIAGVARGRATSQTEFRTYTDLESVYAYTHLGGITDTTRAAYRYVPSSASNDGRRLAALPVFLKETGYEGESNPCATPACIREYGWTAILNGSTAGYWYGHRDVWDFAYATPNYTGAGLFPPYAPWTASVKSTGAKDMSRLAALLTRIAWWKLVPSGSQAPFIGRRLVPSDAFPAAQASDGTLLLVYVPAAGTAPRSFVLDPRSMSGTAEALWWDPTMGDFVGAGTVANGGTVWMTTPGTNGAAENDWVLVLETMRSASIEISPRGASVRPRTPVAFTASGGTGTGYRWRISGNASGASITEAGNYTAGPTTGVIDVVEVRDSEGNRSVAAVSIRNPGWLRHATGVRCGSGQPGWMDLVVAVALAALLTRAAFRNHARR